jgi:hypothetical protein
MDCKAKPEDWDTDLARWPEAILELRARVEALEAAAHKHIVDPSANILALASRVEALEVSKPLKLTPTPNSSQIGRSLVSRVALAISGIEYGLERDEEAINWASEARAAIREVAEWMRSNPDHHFPPALVFALEHEAEI